MTEIQCTKIRQLMQIVGELVRLIDEANTYLDKQVTQLLAEKKHA